MLCFEFAGLINGDVYFEEVGKTGVEVDTFEKSCPCNKNKWLKNTDDNFLLLTSDDQLVFESECDCKFAIQQYKASDLPCGIVPVILTTMKEENGKKLAVCCSSDGQVFPEELDLPNQIDERGHKALFFMRGVEGKCSNTFMFESSLLRANFLGFQPDGAFNKLVLRSKSDEVDEYAHITLE